MLRCFGRTVRVRDWVALIASTGWTVIAAVGCSSGGGATAPQRGSLTVTITAPGSVAPNVMVSGPGGYSKAVATTTTLTGLAVGSYTVTAATVTAADAIVSTVNTAVVTGSPATVVANGTATATAAYSQRPGTGGLWVENATTKDVVQYSAGQLAGTTSAAPATTIGTGTIETFGMAFDAAGDLWVAEAGDNALVEYTASQLGTSGGPTPAVTLTATGASLDEPTGLAFDASGNLWVANTEDTALVEFTASELSSSGSPTPAVTIGSTGGSLRNPIGLAFDARGNLWVSNDQGSTVVEYTTSQLAASGSPAPAVILSTTASSIVGPVSIAFDASGNLWISNAAVNTVVEFTPGQFAATGSPVPAVTLSATAGSLQQPAGLAFDDSGNLWVANNSGPVVQFTASQLVASGSPTPGVVISGSSLQVPFTLAFDPHAANLPLKP